MTSHTDAQTAARAGRAWWRFPTVLNPVRGGEGLVLLFFLALPVLLLWPALLGGKTLIPGDILYTTPPWSGLAAQQGVGEPKNELLTDLVLQNYPWRLVTKQAVSDWELPLWNPHVLAGVPLLGAAQSSALYPLSAPLFLLLPIEHAYAWIFGLHLFIAGLATYLFLRSIGTGAWGALLGGVTFGFAGVFTVTPQWPQVYGVMAWLPALLLCVELVLRRPGAAAALPALAGAGVVSLQFLAGHPEMSFYLLFTTAAYVSVRLLLLARETGAVRPVLAKAVMCLALAGVGALLAGVQLVPLLEAMAGNYRTGSTDLAQARSWALPWYHLAAFLVPDVFGNPTQHVAWGPKNYVEGTAYVGVLPFALALTAWLVRRDRYTVFFSGFGLFCLLLAFGSPLYGLFLLVVPGFDQLHTPFRWVFPYSFAAAVLAARALDGLILGRTGRERTAAAVLASSGVAILVLVPALPGLLGETVAGSAAIQRAFSSAGAFLGYETPHLLLLAGLLVASGAALLALRIHRWAPALVLVVVAVDLLRFGLGFVTFHDPGLLQPVPPVLERLAAREGPFRIVTFGPEKLLPPNSGILAGLQDARGYESIIPRAFVDYWRAMEEPHGLRYTQIDRLIDPASLDSPEFHLLNVRYVLTDRPLDLPHLTLADRGEGLLVYENQRALPRAFAAYREPEEPPESHQVEAAAITEYGTNRVTVRVTLARAGYLVLGEAYAPGWLATDGQGRSLRVERAYRLFRAVALEPGEHLVTFRYFPDSLKLGLYLSFLGVMIMGAAGAALVWRHRFSAPLAQLSTARRVARNTMTPMAAQVAARVVDLGFAIVMLRLLGPADYGGFAVAVALIGYFSLFTDFGLGTLLTREIARRPGAGASYLGNVIAVRLGLCLLAAPALGLAAWAYHSYFDLPAAAAVTAILLMVAVGPGSVAGALSALCSAHERMEFPAGTVVIASLIKSLLGIAVLLLGWGVAGLGLAAVLTNTLTAFLLWMVVRRLFFPPRVVFDRSLSLDMLRTSVPLVLNSLLNTIFFRVDVLLLQGMQDAQTVGIYSTAYKFVDALIIIPSTLTLALFPVMSRQAGPAPAALLQTYGRGLRILLAVALPISLGMTFVATDLVVLLFGPAYRDAGPILQVLIWFLPFSFVNGLTQYVLIALNRQQFITAVFVAATLFNVVGNVLVIPVLGAQGAAITTVLSELVLLVPFLRETVHLLGRPSLSPASLRQDLGLIRRLLKER